MTSNNARHRMHESADDLAELLSRVANRDRVAFAALYRAISPKLYGVVLRILRRNELAEDVLQDVFVTIWTRAGGYDKSLAAPATWMAVIARNRAIDEVRRSRPTSASMPAETFEVADPGKLAPELMEDNQSLRRLEECLAGLAEPRGELVKLAYLEGWSRDELGKRYGHPAGTIKTWLRRSLSQLKECLGS
jgi:RNA polymerase sigma-70 factor, ECF subfamily